jgi:bla regulator protein blaR1
MIASAIINHLWQSTVFSAIAALLALMCRRNRAVWRYGLWLAAAAKFLLPFSWLVALGSRFGTRTVVAVIPVSFGDVFEQTFVPLAPHPPAPMISSSTALVPVLIAAVWIAGVLIVLITWWRQWRPIRAAYRQSTPMTLDFLEQEGFLRVRTSPTLREPGVIGLVRPVLLLPDGITERLTREQLHAVVVHEVCHVQQFDNVAAFLQMMVEAVYWFHPVVWLIERRLVAERELKCDEYVLSRGIQPAVYAKAILNVCRHYVETPLLCAPGVSGSNLKTRIEAIMKNERPHSLDITRRLILGSTVAIAIAWPITVGALIRVASAQSLAAAPLQSPADSARFEVVSIKRSNSTEQNGDVGFFRGGRFGAHNATVRDLITAGYRIQGLQMVDGPAWLASDRFEIEAKAAEDPGGPTRQGPPEMFLAMVRNMLSDRFKLRVRSENAQLRADPRKAGRSRSAFAPAARLSAHRSQ